MGIFEKNTLGGSVAIVTGASRGIGKGIALELGAAGATVYVTGRTIADEKGGLPGSLAKTVAEINDLGGNGIAVACDHADDDETAGLFDRVRTETGRLDILVNNAFRVPAKVDPRVPFWETPISDWDATIDVGTRSAYVCTHHAARAMVPAGKGLIVSVSSAGAIRFFHNLTYGVGKAALDRITKDAARPLAPHGVAIVSIWPFLVRTERVALMAGVDESITESPRFAGRGVVAMASDPNVLARSGRAFTTRSLADDYGFTDVDGELPPPQPWIPPT